MNVAAGEVLQRLPRIEVLVNNVGRYWNTRHVTAGGLERTVALNHLAPFLLKGYGAAPPKVVQRFALRRVGEDSCPSTAWASSCLRPKRAAAWAAAERCTRTFAGLRGAPAGLTPR
jgi:NAD(P)-dependent dehydrogenase (short-subunit alcohol dehydrogenase family)